VSARWLGKAAYGAAFCVALPALLVAWAIRLDRVLEAPALSPWHAGAWIACAGALLMLWSMLELWRRGGGLPMNAFPPLRPVATGPYRVMAHPIYAGAIAVALGLSLWAGSASGLWLVTPTLALGCLALVLGYERQDLAQRFGAVPGGDLTRLPACDHGPRSLRDAASAWIGLQLPFLAIYELVAHLPVPDAFVIAPGEQGWPVLPATTIVYSLAYPLTFAAPLAFRYRGDLRRWMVDAWVAVVVGCLVFLVVPGIAPPRAFDASAPMAWLLELERADGVAGRGALPSFHAFWAFHAARAFLSRGPFIGAAALAVAIGIAVSCVTTGMHATVDVVAGIVLAGAVAWRTRAVALTMALAERLANSWREWRVGPVRIISHAVYPGAAATVGVVLVGWRLGEVAAGFCAMVGVVSLAGACLWGQYWTGSSKLLRPFGYFGSVLALGICVPLLGLLAPEGLNLWTLSAAIALAAPVIVAIGRMRCLVQGCCHGRPMADGCNGIRYRHPRSRVVTIACLEGCALHATPVYSMVANVVVALVLWRGAALGAPCSVLVGGYLILTGLWRFVEESLRGEPQTSVHAGLRLYQWCAFASVLVGMAVTCWASPALPPLPSVQDTPWGAIVAIAVALGALHAVAMGVDFPGSNRRFSRLA